MNISYAYMMVQQVQDGPKVSHYQESSLHRIKNVSEANFFINFE